ncbi:MAG: DUF3467 domain-containing protein [Gemmatimonadales bacterium]|nr:MAG: DUF3467 domain-containing protein [Gemmatimonadales bacterium]
MVHKLVCGTVKPRWKSHLAPVGCEQEPIVENSQNQVPPQFQVEVGEKEAEGIYSNLVFIAHSPSEVILDFARALPGLPKARVHARVIMTPQHAKSLLGALEQNLKNYETQFGAIKLPGDQNPAKGLGFKS